MKQLLVSLLTFLLVALLSTAWAANYNYLSADQLRTQMMRETQIHVLDLQDSADYKAGHLPGAIKTKATPVKSNNDRKKLAAKLAQLNAAEGQILIVSADGSDDAQRAYDYLKKKGISESRLLILESGQRGWPYPDMLATD